MHSSQRNISTLIWLFQNPVDSKDRLRNVEFRQFFQDRKEFPSCRRTRCEAVNICEETRSPRELTHCPFFMTDARRKKEAWSKRKNKSDPFSGVERREKEWTNEWNVWTNEWRKWMNEWMNKMPTKDFKSILKRFFAAFLAGLLLELSSYQPFYQPISHRFTYKFYRSNWKERCWHFP